MKPTPTKPPRLPKGRKHAAKWYLLRWALGWAYLLDGVGCLISLGFWLPVMGLRAENAFLTESEKEAL